jgi:hypothetical protein
MTEKGKWASTYPRLDYYRSVKVQPEVIPFVNELIFFTVDECSPSVIFEGLPEHYIKRLFPQPYYRLEDDRAIAVYGYYVEDLFKLYLELRQN